MKIQAITFDVFGTLLEYDKECLWIKSYVREVKDIQKGKKPYRPLDAIFQEIRADLSQLHLRDGVLDSLYLLKEKFLIAPLSNASSELSKKLVQLFKFPWSMIIPVEIVEAYKPDPRVYELAEYRFANLGIRHDEILHTAAHKFDLQGAKKTGLKTAYLEWSGYAEPSVPDEFDLQVSDIASLASTLVKEKKHDV